MITKAEREFLTLAAALQRSDLAPLTRVLLTTISEQPNGIASLKTLADAGRMSRPSVQRHIKIAVDAGWLIVEPRTHEDGGHAAPRYTITIPDA